MLYNKSAVKRRAKITLQMNNLARQHDPCRLEQKTRDKIEDHFHNLFSAKGSPLKKIERATEELHSLLRYDHQHAFEGIRDAEKVWKSKKGHCIEQNVLLMSVLKIFGKNGRWILAKNPKGYGNYGLDDHIIAIFTGEYGVHPFIEFTCSGNNYVADAVAGTVKPAKNLEISLAEVALSPREFTAFWLLDGAEDLAYVHNKGREAIHMLETAAKVDPNNYTIYLTMGDIYFRCLDDYKNAEQAFRHARRIAPDLLDVYKAYGDFCFEGYETKEYALRAYKRALAKKTSDLQMVGSLELRLCMMDESALSNKAASLKKEIMKSRRMQEYFRWQT